MALYLELVPISPAKFLFFIYYYYFLNHHLCDFVVGGFTLRPCWWHGDTVNEFVGPWPAVKQLVEGWHRSDTNQLVSRSLHNHMKSPPATCRSDVLLLLSQAQGKYCLTCVTHLHCANETRCLWTPRNSEGVNWLGPVNMCPNPGPICDIVSEARVLERDGYHAYVSISCAGRQAGWALRCNAAG